MSRMIWAQLRNRAGRSLALLLGVLVATTGFTVLTGSTETSRLRVTGTLDANARAAYEILVRPKGSRTPLEEQRGLVRPNYLSGLFGGISMAQYEQVRAVSGVELAAPIAMVGYAMVNTVVTNDVTAAVDRRLTQQVIRLNPTIVADRGLTRWADSPSYAYVTKNRLLRPVGTRGGQVRYEDGSALPEELGGECGGSMLPVEVLPDGQRIRLCGPEQLKEGEANGVGDARRSRMQVYQLLPDGRFRLPLAGADGAELPARDRLTVSLPWTLPMLLAAVDPTAEARLAGTDRAVTTGRYLRDDERIQRPRAGAGRVPMLASSRPYVDEQISTTYTRLPIGIAGLTSPQLREALPKADGVRSGQGDEDILAHYQGSVGYAMAHEDAQFGQLQQVIRSGAPSYLARPDGNLAVEGSEADLDAYRGRTLTGTPMPGLVLDNATRPLSQLAGGTGEFLTMAPVGMFDPDKLAGFSELTRVPLETYQAPVATGADPETRRLLGDRALLPSGNPAGYLATPPLMLTSVSVLPDLLAHVDDPAVRAAPLSAVRVRVGGITGYDKATAERVRLIAEEIAVRTGLDVDITFGSSPQPQTVVLPAGKFGRPELRLSEGWSRKGVAAVIVSAVDRKSLILFVLILAVCALFLGNAVSAAVRDRRRELAVLACLGWPARRIGALILGEVAVVGTVAGAGALALAWPVAGLVGVTVPVGRGLLAMPIGLGLALLAGAVPAVRAARAHPAAALRHAVRAPRRGRRRRGVAGMALANIGRVPGRTALGVLSLAIGVCAVTTLAAVQAVFHGQVTGALLGDAVSVRVRGVDAVAAAVILLLGAVAVGDVLYLNVRDRAAELATLRAVGWSEGAVGRLIGYEGLGIGLLGAGAGAAAGLGLTAWFAGGVSAELAAVCSRFALAGALLAVVAALVPALLARRLPTAALLAEE
ncbi:FtsX-like permease family protein [Longispora urticae]